MFNLNELNEKAWANHSKTNVHEDVIEHIKEFCYEHNICIGAKEQILQNRVEELENNVAYYKAEESSIRQKYENLRKETNLIEDVKFYITDILPEIFLNLKEDRRLQALKFLREKINCGLKEGKEVIDKIYTIFEYYNNKIAEIQEESNTRCRIIDRLTEELEQKNKQIDILLKLNKGE